MTVPKINSAHGSDTRNVINRAIEVLNRLGIDVQTLVAEGQLTPEQYASLITVINGMLKSGEIKHSDLSEEMKVIIAAKRSKDDPIDLDDLSESVLSSISGNASFTIKSEPRDNSVKMTSLDSNLQNSLLIPVHNIIENGDFSNGTDGWSNYAATSSTSNGILTSTSISGNFASLIQTTDYTTTSGHNMYVRARIRPRGVTSGRITLRSETSQISVDADEIASPTDNVWYVMDGFVTTSTNNEKLRIYLNYYYDTVGAEIDVDYVTGIDVTSILGSANEPTEQEIIDYFDKLPEKWFEVANWIDLKQIYLNSGGIDEFMTSENELWSVV